MASIRHCDVLSAVDHRDGDACQLTYEVLAAVIAGVRPSRPDGKSDPWETIAAQAEQIKAWLDQDLTPVGTSTCTWPLTQLESARVSRGRASNARLGW
jgi:hypothetical protein